MGCLMDLGVPKKFRYILFICVYFFLTLLYFAILWRISHYFFKWCFGNGKVLTGSGFWLFDAYNCWCDALSKVDAMYVFDWLMQWMYLINWLMQWMYEFVDAVNVLDFDAVNVRVYWCSGCIVFWSHECIGLVMSWVALICWCGEWDWVVDAMNAIVFGGVGFVEYL